MKGVFIKRESNIALAVGTGAGGLKLIAKTPGFEAMRQTIEKNAAVWITPAEEPDTVEFFFVISGGLEMTVDGETELLCAGDSFYVQGVETEIPMSATGDTEVLYITNKPMFDQLFGFQDDLTNLVFQIDAKDHYTFRHSRHVMRYSLKLMERLNGKFTLPHDDLVLAALFHDVGKCFIPDKILKSTGVLCPEDYRYIMRHPIDGGRLLRPHFNPRIVDIVRSHHERCDGSGYPMGLYGEDIDPGALIIAVSDSFDAMTTDRGYNVIKNYEQAAMELNAERDRYDWRITEALVELVREGVIDEIAALDASDQAKASEYVNLPPKGGI